MWKDSVGNVIPIIYAPGSPQAVPFNMPYIDTNTGAIWMILGPDYSVSSGPPGYAVLPTLNPWYTGANCSGTAYVSLLGFARATLTVRGQQGSFMYGDTTAPTSPVFQSCLDNNQVCQPLGNCGNGPGYVVPVSSLVSVQRPSSLPGVPPYHPEFVP